MVDHEKNTPVRVPFVLAGCSTAGAGKMKNTPTVLFDGRTLDGWQQIPAGSWTVTNGAMASLGLARGTIYTTNDYGHYRLTFSMRHISGNKDHQPCFLIFARVQQMAKNRWTHSVASSFRCPMADTGTIGKGITTGAEPNSQRCRIQNSTTTNGAAWKSWWMPHTAWPAWLSPNPLAVRRWKFWISTTRPLAKSGRSPGRCTIGDYSMNTRM
jgi:hypothetical protein